MLSALRILISSSSLLDGFVRKSTAPSRMASTAVSMEPNPVTMITGISGRRRFSSLSSSMPLIFPITMSERTRSYDEFSSPSSAASPFGAHDTRYRSSSRSVLVATRNALSSSTTRMCSCSVLLIFHRGECNGKCCSFSFPACHGNGAMMLLNDAVADGESQPDAADLLFRSKECVEDTVDPVGWNARAVVSDGDSHHAFRGRCLQGDASSGCRRMVLAPGHDRVARIDHHVNKHLLQLVARAAHKGQVIRSATLDHDPGFPERVAVTLGDLGQNFPHSNDIKFHFVDRPAGEVKHLPREL